MLVDSPRQGDLLTNVRACWLRKLDLREIGFDRYDPTSTGCRSDVDEQQFAFRQLLHFRLLLVLRLHPK